MTELDKDGNKNGSSMDDVAKVLRCETFLTERLFFVRWKNPHLKDCWVGESRLQSRPDLLQKYFDEHPEKSNLDINDSFSSTSEATDEAVHDVIQSTDGFSEEDEIEQKRSKKVRLTSRRTMAKDQFNARKSKGTQRKKLNKQRNVFEILSDYSETDNEELNQQIPKTQPLKNHSNKKESIQKETQNFNSMEFKIHFNSKIGYKHVKKLSKIIRYSGNIPPPEKSGSVGAKIIDIIPTDNGCITEVQIPDQPFTKVIDLGLSRYLYPKEICDFLFDKVSKD